MKLKPNAIDVTGQRFGRLCAVKPLKHNALGQIVWLFKCDCGNEHEAVMANVKHGNTNSCGCLKKELASKKRIAKPKKTMPEWHAWQAMLARCYRTSHHAYHRYGGRGIAVCDRWRYSFENFLADMGERPSSQHSLDRKDNEVDYTPDNCRWATRKTQQNNTRRNRQITFRGKTQTATAWSEELGFPRNLVAQRLRYGWSIERALTTPVDLSKASREATT